MRIPLLFACVLPLAALAAGCTVQTTDSAPPAVVILDGTLTVDWTINGYKDAGLCTQSAASTIRIDVQTTSGQVIGSYAQDCAQYATSIPLAPGSYVATATLVDSAGTARTTGVQINPFSIRGNDDIITPIDFPSSSFY